MPLIQLPAIRLYYEEHSAGDPILLIHGMGSDAGNWGRAPEELARLGRVIAYDRRGCTRSERPEPYLRTTVSEHADDAAALLDALHATPAAVVGRSYGAVVALDLALRLPKYVRALVLLEGGAEMLSPDYRAFLEGLRDQIRKAAAERGPGTAGEVLLRGVLGDAGYEEAPEGMKARFAANGPAILAEMEGRMDHKIDLARLSKITSPALVVQAASSPPAFRASSEAMVSALPNAHLVWVEGGHMITPAAPQVVGFLRKNLVRASHG